MMYLSRVELNPYRRETVRALGSPQIMHAAVMAGFASFQESEDNGVLWRIDRVGPSVYLLVQSRTKPDFHHIVDQYGRPACEQTWDTIDYSGFLSTIADGQLWRFRLRANPVHSVADPDNPGKRGKVMAHVTVDQQIGWLLGRTGKMGFHIHDDGEGAKVDIVQREVRRFTRNGKTVTISAVTFEGILVVDDASLLRESMIAGVGRAKAYGCGLLTVARLR